MKIIKKDIFLLMEGLGGDEVSKPYVAHCDLSSNCGAGRLYIVVVVILLEPGLKERALSVTL